MTIRSGRQEAECPPNKDDVKPKTSIKLCWCSVTQSCLTLCNPTDYSTPGLPAFTLSSSLLRLTSIELVMPRNCFIFCHPFLLLSSIFQSMRVFSNELAVHTRWPNCWSFDFSISPFNEYSELISFRIDWFDLLALQGTL